MTISNITLESCLVISNIFTTPIDLQCASPLDIRRIWGVGHNGLIFADLMSFFLSFFLVSYVRRARQNYLICNGI